MKWVVDASVAVKWLVSEDGSEAAQALIDDELIVPDTLFGECANVLWKKTLRGELPDGAAQSAMRALNSASVDVFPSTSLIPRALQLAIQLRHPVYDCIFLALAQTEKARLITADKRLHGRCRQADAQALGLRVQLLGQPEDDSAVH